MLPVDDSLQKWHPLFLLRKIAATNGEQHDRIKSLDMSSCTSCTWKSFMRPYCLVKICKFKLLYIIRITHVNVIRILNAESPTGIQKLHPMQATPSHRLLSLDPSHQRRKSMSGSLYGCPKQSLQISGFLFTQLGKPKMCQN